MNHQQFGLKLSTRTTTAPNGRTNQTHFMKKILAFGALLIPLALSSNASAAIVLRSAQSIQTLATSSNYTVFGGLMKDGQKLYYGNFDSVRSYNLSSQTESLYCKTQKNASTKALGKVGSSMYIAMDRSYAAPYPSTLGSFSPSSGFTPTLESGSEPGEATYSIFDAAVFGNQYYFVANPGMISNPQGGPTGTRIYRYDPNAPSSPVEIARIGGLSGGLTFDAAGNLYYASQNDGEGVLKFDAQDVLVGHLDASDGTTVADIMATSLDFLSTGELVASTGFGKTLSTYDLQTGEKQSDIATLDPNSSEYFGKFVVGEDDSLYALSTDWDKYAGSLSVIAVPEPASVLLFGVGSFGILMYRRRKKWLEAR